MLLDEPTNHLDIDGKEALEEALTDYPGTVLMISHDRYFIDCIAHRVLELEDGRIHEYLGNYSEYLEKKALQAVPPPAIIEPSPVPVKPVVSSSHDETKRRGLQYRQRQQQEIETRISKLEARKDKVETLLASPELYADGLRSIAMTTEHQQLLHDLTVAYAEWETVAEEIIVLETEAEKKAEGRRQKAEG